MRYGENKAGVGKSGGAGGMRCPLCNAILSDTRDALDLHHRGKHPRAPLASPPAPQTVPYEEVEVYLFDCHRRRKRRRGA